ncbi:TauD/TfdA family dioxygenase [Actinophytocola sp.]|uniref:TauD/TfdA family dioxygenase n=1 Tax=Actinophytocola sp. TaxID=1872138 RepID=UPI002D7E4B37|nr:TauD/TfdA family dioxygenase [Actinophytocola sp.]HET9140038.1 TauD/TfdA family dioxygenase [Actinophytocola sp.]
MRTVLVAGRSVVAKRTMESCAGVGFTPVAVVARSDPQRGHLGAARRHVVLDCDRGEACPGYDCVDCVVRAAERAGVDAVHPGLGAIAEDPALGRRLAGLGIRVIGPPPEVLAVTGDKGASVTRAERIGVPVLPHASGARGIRSLVAGHGFPIVLKPVNGNQGNGVVVVGDEHTLSAALAGDAGWYAETHVGAVRVVGMTVAVDEAGTVAVLGEKESLLLAGSRKLVEAGPVLDVPADLVRAMRADAARLAVELGVRNVSTVEFLACRDGYTFLEINARLTGSYRMCEEQTGLDLIALQLRLANGYRLTTVRPGAERAPQVVLAHVYLRAAAPKPGSLTRLRLPRSRAGVRVDCLLAAGRPLPFDSLAAQVMASAADRARAVDAAIGAVAGIELAGVEHHAPDITSWWAERNPGVARPDEFLGSTMSIDDTLVNVIHEVDPEVAVAVAGGTAPDARFVAMLRDYERRHLRNRPGYFILSGLGQLDEANARRFILAVSDALGGVVPQGFDGELIRAVRYRGVTLEGTATARYSDTRQGGNPHTDGMHRPGPIPAYFALHCVRQAAVGGALFLLHIDDLVRELRDRPEVLAALTETVHFDTRDRDPARPATVPRPILELDGDTARITYIREYIETGHLRPGVPPLRPAQRSAMDALDELLARPDLQTHLRLEPGQLIVINNRTLVHGRTPFEVSPGDGMDRLLLRTWIAGTR